jgi:asparagine synthase (glutamine-hydrolysing)
MLAGGRVALGHRRLAILDLSTSGLQPMCDSSEQVWLTYNGEIFNYLELRRELESNGYPFKSRSDTEVIIALYMRHGMRMLSRLRGMFAFVLHDERTGETFYARDPIGIKPLYARDLPDGIALASEPSALAGLGPNHLDLEPLVRSVMFLYPPGTAFGIREIRRIPPGSAVRVGPDGASSDLECVALLPDGRGPAPGDPSAAEDALEQELRTSVREHLASDTRVGIAFSGGLDSSLVARLAADQTSQPIRLFSFLSHERGVSERLDDPKAIQSAASRLGLQLTTVGPPADFLDSVDRVVRGVGEPVSDPASIAFLQIAKAARAEGHFVLLSGHGADELLAGYRRHFAARTILPHPAFAKAIVRTGAMVNRDALRLREVLREHPRHWLALLHSAVRACRLPEILSQGVLTSSLDSLLSPVSRAAARTVGAAPLRRSMDLDFQTYLPDQNLNYLDKVSMAHGVEGRVPYLTRPVISLCATLPETALFDGLRGKAILRRLARRLLPREILALPKRGFGIPLRYLVERHWAEIRGRLTDRSAPASFLWSASIRSQVDRRSLTLPPPLVFSMLVLDRWFREWRPVS